MLSTDAYGPPASRVFRFGLGVAVCAAAVLLRLSLTPLLQSQAPYLVHLAGVALATWVGAAEAGLIATVLGAFAIHLLVVHPAATPPLTAQDDLPGMLLFIAVGLGMVWQVSRWRRAEQGVRAQRERLARLVDVSAQIVWVTNANGDAVEDSPSWRAFTGRKYDQWAGWNWADAIHPADREQVSELWRKALSTRDPYSTEFRLLHRSGEYRHVSCNAVPILDVKGKVLEWIGMNVDITEQKRALATLQELTQRLTYHVDHSPLAVIEWGPDMRLIRWSGAAQRLFGWSAEEVLGKRIEDLQWVFEGDHSQVSEVVVDLQSGRNPRRFSANRNYRKDGSVVYCEWYNSSLLSPAGELRSILSLVLDVTERKRLEDDLLAHAEQLARANRLKDEFLATLSHEMRTPLNAIVGWSRILSSGDITPDMQKRGISVIARNAHAQTRLIEDVLDLSRIVTGTFKLDLRAVEVAATVDAALESIRPAAEAKGVTIDPPDVQLTTVVADPGRLQQVIWNLLSNAVKFTPAGGWIRVRACRRNSHVEIEVSDSGIGLAPDFLPHAFERFTQADSSSTREHAGLGLGLAIVRHIVELHGGSVTARSDGKSLGSTFIVRLPLRVVETAVPWEAPAKPTVAHFEPSGDLAGIRILVVDDDEEAREVMEAILAGQGSQVVLARSAREALSALSDAAFDLLVSDIGMPHEDGYTLIHRVRALPGRKAAIPAVALTGHTLDRAQTLAAGYDHHVTKPVAPNELVAVLSSVLRRAGSADAMNG
jgi:hypothetical protein